AGAASARCSAVRTFVHAKPAEELVKARNWRGALAATEPGLAKLDPAPRRELVKWRGQIALRWSRAEVDAGRLDEGLAVVEEAASLLTADDKKHLIVALYDTRAKAVAKTGAWSDAADLYARALNLYPNDDLLKNNVGWLAQEWQKAAYAKGGTAEVAAVQARPPAKCPGVATAGTSGRDQIRRTVSDQVRSRDYAKALETLKSAGTLLAEADRTELNELIYDRWAKERVAAKDWAGAADIYARGLTEAGASSLLRHNVVYLAQEWARAAFAQGGGEGVIDVARQVIAKFPNVPE